MYIYNTSFVLYMSLVRCICSPRATHLLSWWRATSTPCCVVTRRQSTLCWRAVTWAADDSGSTTRTASNVSARYVDVVRHQLFTEKCTKSL